MILPPPRNPVLRASSLSKLLAVGLVATDSSTMGMVETLTGARPSTIVGNYGTRVGPYGRELVHNGSANADGIDYTDAAMLRNLRPYPGSHEISISLVYTYNAWIGSAGMVSRSLDDSFAMDWVVRQTANGGQKAMSVSIGTKQWLLGVFNFDHDLGRQYVMTFSRGTSNTALWSWSKTPTQLRYVLDGGGGQALRSPSTEGSLYLFRALGPAFNDSSPVSLAGVHVWNRSLSPAEHLLLQRDPWAMYSPSRIISGATAEAASAGLPWLSTVMSRRASR